MSIHLVRSMYMSNERRRVFRWPDLLAMEPYRKVHSLPSYVYYCLLAGIAERGFRLSSNDTRAMEGKFEHIPNEIMLMDPLLITRSEDESSARVGVERDEPGEGHVSSFTVGDNFIRN